MNRLCAFWCAVFFFPVTSVFSKSLRFEPKPRSAASSIGLTDTNAAAHNSLQMTQDRMQWWATGTPKPILDKYVLFTGDAGGPNNIRIGWEMTGLVALSTNRTLVLPPAWRMYLLDFGPMTNKPNDFPAGTETLVEDLINLQQLKAYLPTLTWEEFTSKTSLSWDDAVAEAEQVDQDQMCLFESYKKISGRILFMPGDGSRREGFTCVEWYERGGPRDSLREGMTDAHWALLTHGFVWHPDAFNIASHVVNHLGIFEYNAIHARYNDFQFHESQSTGEEIINRWKPFFEEANKLYVASDEPDKVANLRGLDGVDVSMFRDAVQGVLKDLKGNYSSERWFKLLGPVEELICTYAKIFIGTKQSSFSGHINRMRVHAGAYPQVLILIDPPAESQTITSDVEAWQAREYVRKQSSTGDQFLYLSDAVSDLGTADIVGEAFDVSRV